MDYRLLGRSGLKVSSLAIGTVTFGNDGVWGETDLKDAQRQIDLCLDHGVNLIDTANVYNDGKSESMIGEVLTADRRERLLISTKVRFPTGKGPNDEGLSRHHIIRACEASLKRLKTDVIDLYHVHEWDGQTPLEETVEALDTLVKQGKVRYLACSNYSAWHLMKALSIADAGHYQRFVGQQIHYTLHSREAEYELVPLGLDQGVSILVWSPLAGGWLSGKYTRHTRPDSGRQVTGFKEPPIYDWDHLWNIVDVVNEVAAAHGVSGAQVSLAWLLQRPLVASVIIGGRNTAQFEDNLEAADLRLSADEVSRLDTVSQPPLIYPYWHQSFTARARLSEADQALHRLYPEG
ncbi:MAG: aldo/keto reductase [Devosia nanyangense]|uniref:Aldo/keto reductase n=1 Tax=Devosia nanyangense TaxID=1228055 RepID=A0A933NZM8_9HYPH|nr:aldo/keto reductase [Devosia nanyangense]